MKESTPKQEARQIPISTPTVLNNSAAMQSSNKHVPLALVAANEGPKSTTDSAQVMNE